MPHCRWPTWLNNILSVVLLLAVTGCEQGGKRERSIDGVGTSRRTGASPAEIAAARLAQTADTQPALSDEVPSRPIGPVQIEPVAAVTDVIEQIPDPGDIGNTLDQERDAELALLDNRVVLPEDKRREQQDILRTHERRLAGILAKTEIIKRPLQTELSLTDTIRRALKNNYLLQVQAYNPAIDATHIVEAEAQFDAVYFIKFNSNKVDRPTSSQLMSSASNTRTFESGIRKLLSTGMQVQVSYALTRTWTNLVFATLNPSYFNNFVVEFRQPLLRGFGLDYNRAQIEIRKLDRRVSLERLKREIRETIFNVEQAYWRLVQARRAVTVSSRLLTDLETILEWLEQRKEAGYDVYGVQLNLVRSRIEQRRAEFIRRCNEVENAEDVLKTLMNDPELNLSKELEIIPIDSATLEPVVLDELGEVSAALTHRAELHEARHTIEQAQLAVGVAKNQAMPKLDATLRYIVDGLGGDPHDAFSQLSTNDFHEYVIGIEFEWPIGNRGPEAALRRARLQQAQAIANHRAQIESVLREVRQAIRELRTNYAQIGPALRAARASRDQLRATKARQERLDPPSLQVELDAHEALASARDGMIQLIANYNIAISNLERRKDTLLEYNNVVIRGLDEETSQNPYQPSIP